MEDRPQRGENAGHSLQKKTEMRIEGNVRLKDMDIEWRNEATLLGSRWTKNSRGEAT